MNSRNNIKDELKELNSQLPLEKGPEVYSVPQGYFDRFAGLMLQKIRAEQAVSALEEIASLSPLLAGLSKKMPFAVPEGYFSQNIEDVPILVNEEVLPDFLQNTQQMP